MNFPGRGTRLALISTGVLTATALGACYRPDRSPADVESHYSNEDSEFTNLDGTRVHYRDTGEGPAVLLLHGIASSLHTWSGWVNHLQDSFRLIRLDLPGFGLSDPVDDDDYSTSTYVRFLHNFLAGKNLTSVAIAGSSFGGRLALRYAMQYPDQVQKIILLNSMGLERNWPIPFSIPQMSGSEFVMKFSPRFLVRTILNYLYGDPEHLRDSVVERYYELLLRKTNRRNLIQFLRHTPVPDTELEGSLRTINLPVLLQWGCRDPWITTERADRFHQSLPNSSLITYLLGGHVPMEELSTQTAHDARSFLGT